jgi:subtilisin family serine protease
VLIGVVLQTGTSLAAPHVAGALALLLNADPNLTVAEQRAALLAAAIDLGLPGPDNDYGYGRLDVLRAYRSLLLYHAYLPLIAAGPLPSP